MLCTTTSTVEGQRVTQYLGVVTGEAILGTNFFKDIFAGITDLIGGRSATYERELRKARDIAMREMQEEAQRLGANAVIGVDIDYEEISPGQGTMLMVSISGTAVVLGN